MSVMKRSLPEPLGPPLRAFSHPSPTHKLYTHSVDIVKHSFSSILSWQYLYRRLCAGYTVCPFVPLTSPLFGLGGVGSRKGGYFKSVSIYILKGIQFFDTLFTACNTAYYGTQSAAIPLPHQQFPRLDFYSSLARHRYRFSSCRDYLPHTEQPDLIPPFHFQPL